MVSLLGLGFAACARQEWDVFTLEGHRVQANHARSVNQDAHLCIPYDGGNAITQTGDGSVPVMRLAERTTNLAAPATAEP